MSRGTWAGLAGLCVAGLLAASGLAWATASALRLEAARQAEAAEAERAGRMRLALWRLDARVSDTLAREDGRPGAHYAAFGTPVLVLCASTPVPPGRLSVPSPLLSADLPAWLALHAEVHPRRGWSSPLVPTDAAAAMLERLPGAWTARARLEACRRHLYRLAEAHPAAAAFADLAARLPAPSDPPPAPTILPSDENLGRRSESPGYQFAMPQQQLAQREFQSRAAQGARNAMENKGAYNNLNDALPDAPDAPVGVGSMRALWLGESLLLARRVTVGGTESVQVVALDWPLLRSELLDLVTDLFPEAALVPRPADAPAEWERSMTGLPVDLDAGPPEPTGPLGWTTLRLGLTAAWIAAIVALVAVGLGGAAVLSLAARRVRFVSAVTHELRTPLTTLRLYLDLLTSGLVSDPERRREYLETLHHEAERLHRLIGNVLDFARLERSRVGAECRPTDPAALLERLRESWAERCRLDGKELVLECEFPSDARPATDAALLEQIAGNLIDNARKYARGSDDPRIVVRLAPEAGRLLLEVRDFGPGVAARERSAVFRPFRRGRDVDAVAGGVGLGLALAARWARALGGRLELVRPGDGPGALFRAVV